MARCAIGSEPAQGLIQGQSIEHVNDHSGAHLLL